MRMVARYSQFDSPRYICRGSVARGILLIINPSKGVKVFLLVRCNMESKV